MTAPPLTEYVTLVSNDAFEFKVLRSAAVLAGTIKKALDPSSNFKEGATNRVTFHNINGVILEKVCEYLYYNQKHEESKDVPDFDLPPELCLELIVAADYLGV
ncbi:transcription elongation factor-like protein B polypeptide 1 [Zopfia rhizophila CBS 207.26]|uniref:Elongin-C n=1 Tax=Zopfia rhizophila CBS 207.26 TaxID=1314779 RepID=A0A6A6EH00_9PEZI|nr:transcription elongation factor-like protein B polypeptide 1 [Zopfia rhizophila CBS 207.26]